MDAMRVYQGSDKSQAINDVIDHLVDALGGEPSCTLRRAVILADIDENPGTTQAEIIERLGASKSALNRDIEWLYDYGCIIRKQSSNDARSITLNICGYSKKNLDYAMEYFSFSHKSLKNFLISLINIFGSHKPTLRDAKIVSVVGLQREVTKQEILAGLFDGAHTTENRAINNLVDFGLIEKRDDSNI
jgi:DNA-binding MarR family transcriptional regulator